MQPLDRQLDRASAVSAPAEGPARRLPTGSVHQAGPAPHDNGTPLSGSASFGCVCGHSRHAHRGYGPCLEPGCTCWTVRKPSTQEEAPALSPQPGA
jgi:hypothetical protein